MKKGFILLFVVISILVYSCNGNANGTSRTDSASPSIKDTSKGTMDTGSNRMDSTKTDSTARK